MTAPAAAAPHLVHRTARIRLRLTRRQARRCYGLLRSAGDVWAWLLDANRRRHQQGEPAISNYQALCRELAKTDGGRRRTHKRRVADAGRAPSRRHGAGTA